MVIGVSFGKTIESLKSDIHYSGENTIIYYADNLTIVLPATLTTIESEAFMGGSFHSVRIPASVTNIAPDAFGDRDNLIIFGSNESYAQTYAMQNGYAFIPTE